MKTISMLEFRKTAHAVLGGLRKGESYLLTYRGRPVATLEPVRPAKLPADDPIYTLHEIASDDAVPLTNAEIDRAVYGI
jgi:antitoxin (DNA-binding transcriptional repressor) of toxin-antitoxin stability system